MTLKILVCGGRDFVDYEYLDQMLSKLIKPGDIVIHGAARGADLMAKEWADVHQIEERGYPAQWNTHGKAAGHLRNYQMLVKEEPDIVVAFPGGKGTLNMMSQAKIANVPVINLFHYQS